MEANSQQGSSHHSATPAAMKLVYCLNQLIGATEFGEAGSDSVRPVARNVLEQLSEFINSFEPLPTQQQLDDREERRKLHIEMNAIVDQIHSIPVSDTATPDEQSERLALIDKFEKLKAAEPAVPTQRTKSLIEIKASGVMKMVCDLYDGRKRRKGEIYDDKNELLDRLKEFTDSLAEHFGMDSDDNVIFNDAQIGDQPSATFSRPEKNRLALIGELCNLLIVGNRLHSYWKGLKDIAPIQANDWLQSQAEGQVFDEMKTKLIKLFHDHPDSVFEAVRICHADVKATNDHYRAIFASVSTFRWDSGQFMESREKLDCLYQQLLAPPLPDGIAEVVRASEPDPSAPKAGMGERPVELTQAAEGSQQDISQTEHEASENSSAASITSHLHYNRQKQVCVDLKKTGLSWIDVEAHGECSFKQDTCKAYAKLTGQWPLPSAKPGRRTRN